MRKRSILIIISIIVIGLVILGLYSTFASDGTITGGNNVYNITLTENGGQVNVPAGKSKTVIYQITNTNKGTVQYGLAFAGDNIDVKVYDDSKDKVTGNIDYGETKFIKLLITNTGTSDSTASIKGIMGYKKGGELSGSNIVPSGHGLVTEVYSKYLSKHIINLYLANKDTEPVVNNNISYGYASIYDKDDDDTTSGGLMNDRKGTMSVGEDAGNVRYYGANPNNYIYFNCSDYSNQSESTCDVWRIIGVFDGKVKIMRNEAISGLDRNNNSTGFSWDNDMNNGDGATTASNDWNTSSLQEFLNGKYYNRGEDSTYSYYSFSDKYPITVDLADIGIKNDDTRKLISKTIWYLRAVDDASLYSNQFYDYERNSGILFDSTRSATTSKNIGLSYISDYGYAADFNSCEQTLSNYNNETCTSTNWIFSVNNNMMWFLNTASVNSNYVWFINKTSGKATYSDHTKYSLDAHPNVYLDSKTSIEGGNGSEGNPYRLYVESDR